MKTGNSTTELLERNFLNELLKDLSSIRYEKAKDRGIEQVYSSNESDEDDEDYGGTWFEVYSLPIEGLFLKLTIEEDSYGSNEWVTAVQFVKKVEKETTKYE